MPLNPPLKCCAQGFRHHGEPKGSIIKLGTVEAYIAEPTGSLIHRDAAIVVLPDVFGIWQNTKLIADEFAANGYFTIIPDQFRGDALVWERFGEVEFEKWIANHKVQDVEPVVDTAVKYLAEEKGIKRVGAVGYCFGARYVARYLANGRAFTAGYVAHPSFVEDDEISAIARPYSIAAAQTDDYFPSEQRHRTEVLLAETKVPFQISFYGGVGHGFAVRCDTSVKSERFAKEVAFLQAITWFNEYLL